MKISSTFQYLAILIILLCASLSLWAQSGSLDPTFGDNGLVTTPGTIGAVALAIQTDGKIVVAGAFPISTSSSGLAVARYNTNGSLDSTFGKHGIVTSNQFPAFAMALQADQKILLAVPGPRFNVSVIRLNTNGAADTTFGSAGIATFSQFGRVFQPISGSILVQPDANILLAVGSPILRLLPSGQVDTSFGKNGAASLIEGSSVIALLPSGQILALSSFTFSAGTVARYNADGSLDRTFAINGQAAGLGGIAAITPLSSGKFLLGGAINAVVPPIGSVSTEGFLSLRYNTTGSLDSTFGKSGGVITVFPGDAFSAAASLAVQTNGDLVAAGTAEVSNPAFGLSQASFALARYTSSGALDTTFGTGGRVTTAFGSDSASIVAIALQSDGKIVAVGNVTPAVFGTPNQGFTLARYLP